jgi:hypothetical protein
VVKRMLYEVGPSKEVEKKGQGGTSKLLEHAPDSDSDLVVAWDSYVSFFASW